MGTNITSFFKISILSENFCGRLLNSNAPSIQPDFTDEALHKLLNEFLDSDKLVKLLLLNHFFMWAQ